MKIIITSSVVNYGFTVSNWSMTVIFRGGRTKVFYLGQDVKWCRRVLGIEMDDVFQFAEIKSRDWTLNYEINQIKLGRFIKRELGLTSKILHQLQPWELCCQ